MAIVANGGAADLRFKQGQAHQGVSGPAGGSGGPISAMRTMEFRQDRRRSYASLDDHRPAPRDAKAPVTQADRRSFFKP